jgi:16S rRNA (guanine(1405)-N(7))-methyltransferase
VNYLNTENDNIVNELKASKKYNVLCLDTIKHVVNIEVQKHKSPKNAVKSARKKLHLILADYLNQLNYSIAEKELKYTFSSKSHDKINETCLMIMEKHASTRERIPTLEEFYSSIFEITGTPGKLADLACALNPFSFRWMGLPKDIHYYAFDNNIKIFELLKLYFKLEGLNPLVEWRDIFCNPPRLSFDVSLLFKMYHCLEHRQKGAGWEVVQKTPTQWIAVSFPTRNLANRKVDIFSNYKDTLLNNIKKNNWEFHVLEFQSELVLLIKSFCGGPGGGFYKKSPLAVGDKQNE